MRTRNSLLLTIAVWMFCLPDVGVCYVQQVTSLARQGSTNVTQVIVVFKTHFDIGYTDLADNVVTRYRSTMIDKALDLIDQSRQLPLQYQLAWTVPGWPLQQILFEGQSRERRERVLKAIRDGRLAFHVLPFTTHTESLDLEDLVRGLGFSSSLARDLGLPLPRDAKMTDVPEHTWIIPTILRHAGVTFLHIGCNGMSSPPEVPDLFWWEGPDGSRLLTMNTGKSYGTGLLPPPARTRRSATPATPAGRAIATSLHPQRR
jgi:alpha-mannosidase